MNIIFAHFLLKNSYEKCTLQIEPAIAPFVKLLK